MRRLLFILALPLTAQISSGPATPPVAPDTAPVVAVSATATLASTAPGQPASVLTKVMPTVRPRPVLLYDWTCTLRPDGLADVGDIVSCVLSLNQKARGDAVVHMIYIDGSGWTGPETVTIPNAQISATFEMTAIDPPPTTVAYLMPWSAGWNGEAPEHFAALGIVKPTNLLQ